MEKALAFPLPPLADSALICQRPFVQSDVRAVLQYVPSFRGKVFVVVLNAGRMTELALAEALLDLSALQQVGVRLIVVSTGSGEAEISQRLIDGELKWGASSLDDIEKMSGILDRGQLVLIEVAGIHPLGSEMVNLATTSGAAKLIAFQETAVTQEGMSLHAISRDKAASWQGEWSALFSAAADACNRGIRRVHLLDETHQGVLMDELFSNEGVGVMIHSDDYLSVRAISTEDIPELLAMIGRSIRDAHLVPRSYEEIEGSLSDFQVLTIDDNVVGCVALHPYPEGCGEIACLYVKQNHGAEGYGKLLVEAAEKRAAELALPWVFALSTRAVDYFVHQLGYQPIDLSEIPATRQDRLRLSQRESVVLKKTIIQ
ncbi:GNAT family N-acetyltransferase [Akkermansiaceae bacterium]|nr:GNAT family N-acetyltransferase [Akkermansiaceae bacterium]